MPSMIVLHSQRQPGACAVVDPDRGATVRSWVAAPPGEPPSERLHLEEWAAVPNPPDLPGGIPVLFPFAGRVAAPPALVQGTWRWNGAAFSGMPIHGFAWRLPWSVAEVLVDAAEFVLESSPVTMALFPFPFRLRYRVEIAADGALSLSLRIANTGDEAMPCSPGFHPYFRLPAAGCARLEFDGEIGAFPYDSTCTRLVPPLLPPGTPLPSGPHIRVSREPRARLVLPGATICLSSWQSGPAPDRFFWQPYARAGVPFQCIEPWTAPAGAVNHGPDWFPPPIPPGHVREFGVRVVTGTPMRGRDAAMGERQPL